MMMRQGQCFKFAMPNGWRVAEDGQFAVVVVAPDNSAMTVMVGNSVMPHYHPGQFVYEKLLAMQPQNLQLSHPRPAQPVNGFSTAYEFDYMYVLNGIPWRGTATCSIAPSYDTCMMVMTCGASVEPHWYAYVSWLPQLAKLFQATNPNAFGRYGMMQQNLDISNAQGQMWQEYSQWSQDNWNGVVAQRQASQDRNNFHFRENLGNVQTFKNPYTDRQVEMPANNSYYWVNERGETWGTNDPNENPNVGSNNRWVQMERFSP